MGGECRTSVKIIIIIIKVQQKGMKKKTFLKENKIPVACEHIFCLYIHMESDISLQRQMI